MFYILNNPNLNKLRTVFCVLLSKMEPAWFKENNQERDLQYNEINTSSCVLIP